jgi:hypothetical protein
MRSTRGWTRARNIRRCALVALVVALAPPACGGNGDDRATTTPPDATAASTAPVTTVITTTLPAVPTASVIAPAEEQFGGSELYSIDLDSGAATALGRIGGDDIGVLGLAFAPGDSLVYALTDAPQLVTFDATDPSTPTAAVPITGVAAGSTLLALDVDAAEGTVLAVSDAAVLYAIDPVTGAAAPIGDGLGVPIVDPGFGFDIDPVTGLGRVEVATGEHLLVVLATGAIDADGESTVGQPLAFAPADGNAAVTPRVVAAASTANGELYVVDAATRSLARQDPPDDGMLTTVGLLGVEISDGASFDISATGLALVASPG